MPGCNYSSFDSKTIRTIYLCKIHNDINTNNSLSEIKINDNDEDNILKRLKQQIDFSNSSNIKIVKCLFIFYNSKLFTENRGFYIMFFTVILHLLLLMFPFPSKLDKQLKIFCNIILSQMKKIFKKGQNKTNLKIKDVKINENTNIVNNKTIDIHNNNTMRITTSSNSDDTSSSDSQEIDNENIKNDNLFNDKPKHALTSKIENNNDLKIHSSNDENFKELSIEDSKNEYSNIYNNEARFDTYKNESNIKLSVDISKIENTKEISSNSSQRILKNEKNNVDPKKIRDNNSTNIDSSIIAKKDKRNIHLNDLDNTNNDKIIGQLKKKIIQIYIYFMLQIIFLLKKDKNIFLNLKSKICHMIML